jgi:hypothetical protein
VLPPSPFGAGWRVTERKCIARLKSGQVPGSWALIIVQNRERFDPWRELLDLRDEE